jgi:hypothetical protein
MTAQLRAFFLKIQGLINIEDVNKYHKKEEIKKRREAFRRIFFLESSDAKLRFAIYSFDSQIATIFKFLIGFPL